MPFGIFNDHVEKIKTLTNPLDVKKAIYSLRLLMSEEDIDFLTVKDVSVFLADKEKDFNLVNEAGYLARMQYIKQEYFKGLAQQKEWAKQKQAKMLPPVPKFDAFPKVELKKAGDNSSNTAGNSAGNSFDSKTFAEPAKKQAPAKPFSFQAQQFPGSNQQQTGPVSIQIDAEPTNNDAVPMVLDTPSNQRRSASYVGFSSGFQSLTSSNGGSLNFDKPFGFSFNSGNSGNAASAAATANAASFRAVQLRRAPSSEAA